LTNWWARWLPASKNTLDALRTASTAHGRYSAAMLKLAAFFAHQKSVLTLRTPGVLVCAVIALAATFLSEHYGGPQLLYALLFGLSFHFLMKNEQVKPGIDFCARTVLRLGVALLGARITLSQVAQLGVGTGVLIAGALALTVVSGLVLARMLGRSRDEGFLSGGAVAICGASAALAIASVLPQSRANERFTLLTVVGVTVLSTLAMIFYPFALQMMGLNATQSGIFLGGTIHDVAQVVAAGMMLGPQAGDVATVVKLFRVMLLMPVVVVVALMYRANPQVNTTDEPMPLVPGFLLAFIVLVLLASSGVLAPPVVQTATSASRWMLVAAIAAAGVKTSFEELMQLGWRPVVMLLGETLWLAALVLAGLLVLKLGV
jgi:uncharacterized integral membrane protein (TIGR00698 family)